MKNTPNPIIWIFRQVERACAMLQGKGYGGRMTIGREVNLASKLHGKHTRLAVDVGGNVGNYTAALLRKSPAVEIHIFEPSHTNIQTLTARFANLPQVVINGVALSNSVGEATLYANRPGSGLGSLAKRDLKHLSISFDWKEQVKTVRFEDYWRVALGGRAIDIVKLDIEGHELTALQGFGVALDHCSVVQFEFGGCNIDTRTQFRDFWTFFSEREFDLYRMSPFGLEMIQSYCERDEFYSTTNYLAAKRSAQ